MVCIYELIVMKAQLNGIMCIIIILSAVVVVVELMLNVLRCHLTY